MDIDVIYVMHILSFCNLHSNSVVFEVVIIMIYYYQYKMYFFTITDLQTKNARSEMHTNAAVTAEAMTVNTLRPRQDGRRFTDDTFERIFLNENFIVLIKISLKFVAFGTIDNIPALVQIMAWRRPGDKPLTEPMMARLPTHICVARPQWVKLPFLLDSVNGAVHKLEYWHDLIGSFNWFTTHG